MNKRNLVIIIVTLLIIAGGAGYYLKKEKRLASPNTETAAPQANNSLLDTFFNNFSPSKKSENQPSLKEYKDSAGTISIQYPASWVVRGDQGRILSGASFTPSDLLNKYPVEEQKLVKGLVVSAIQSKETPENYYKSLVAGLGTGETEHRKLTINGYQAYLTKGNIKGISYTIYLVSNGNYITYLNYRTREDELAHQNDIKKAIDFSPYTADFEAAINSIKFLK